MFLINVPLGVIAFAVAWRLVANRPGAGAPAPLDWPGVLLTCTGLAGLTYAAHLLSLPDPPAGTAGASRRGRWLADAWRCGTCGGRRARC